MLLLTLHHNCTFALQVAACWSESSRTSVAVKVIKNQPAYYHQARVEVGVLQLLNSRCDAGDTHHIVRMHDFFLFRKHLCLVFEQLDVNLFELLKRHSFRGLSLNLLRLFLRQVCRAGGGRAGSGESAGLSGCSTG